MSTLILLRNGQSAWNKKVRFIDWIDLAQTAEGVGLARVRA